MVTWGHTLEVERENGIMVTGLQTEDDLTGNMIIILCVCSDWWQHDHSLTRQRGVVT